MPLSPFTQAVHSGRIEWRGSDPSSPAIVPASGFSFADMEALDAALGDDRAGYVYSRHGGPTQEQFEAAMAALEGGEGAVSFASGMAALYAAFVAAGAGQGATVVAAQEGYGAVHTLLNWMARTTGLKVRYVRIAQLDEIERVFAEERPALFTFEILTNPSVRVADAPALVERARRHGVKVVVDSTFTTPVLVQPLALGADLVAHSATKYIGGHGDVLAGVVAASAEWCDRLRTHRRMAGSNLSAFDAFLCLRGLRTLPLRFRQQCENARVLAQWLIEHPRVQRVYYPGLASDPDHATAQRVLRPGGFGAMLAFDVKGAGRAEAFAILERFKIAQRIASLGDVATLVSYPPHASHRALTPEQRRDLGIGDGMIRVSAGIEDVRDLIEDFEQALA